jgi:glycosyltransferase involved in cell wall biosynthesis
MQHSPLRLIDLNYYMHRDISDPEEVLAIHAPAQGYASFLSKKIQVEFIKHAACKGPFIKEGICYRFFKKQNSFWHIPFATHRYIKKQRPDAVIVQGLIFPLQVIALRLLLGKKVQILLQHHGEKPFSGIKRMVQRLAGRVTDGCLFTSNGNAKAWMDKGIITSAGKCHEVLEASSYFQRNDKKKSREILGIDGGPVFLWVGRLHILKDPITVLKAFEQWIATAPAASLYLIYQTEELLYEIKQLLAENSLLNQRVHLVGKVEHQQLPVWYSAADYFVSGSYKEGSGYALIEAMACGCIPVVTAIPSFIKITGNGKAGFLFEPGNAAALLNLLQQLEETPIENLAEEVTAHFKKELSFQKIASGLEQLIGSGPAK